LEAAWQAYEEFSNAGGQQIPAAPWIELIRHLENLQDYSRAVAECDKLAQAFPQERPALMALLTAGRICLKNLKRPDDALRYYIEPLTLRAFRIWIGKPTSRLGLLTLRALWKHRWRANGLLY